MSTINPESKEISVKIVYYGPGLGGKTSSLQAIHRMLDPKTRGQLISLATGTDRTLYFDFLPVKAKFRGFTVRLQLYTVPGQVHYNATRKLVLQGADGVVFVADSQPARTTANEESLSNLEDNLSEQGVTLKSLPLVLQYNKRDVPGAVPAQVLNDLLNRYSSPTFDTVATNGEGIFEALKAITTDVLEHLSKKMPGSLPTSSLREITGTGMGTGARGDEASEGRRRRASTSPLVQSLTDLADAMEPPEEEDADSVIGVHRVTPGKRSLIDLVQDPSTRQRIAFIEEDIENGKWDNAVKNAVSTYQRVAERIATTANSPREAASMAAFEVGLPARWFHRFYEIEQRILGDGAVTSEDAAFALFFCCALAVGGDERA